ncbi:MAG: hypothetical protein ACRDH6_08410 [Actinomycetota bacterium]
MSGSIPLGEAAGLPPAASPRLSHLRLSDVIDELQALADLATNHGPVEAADLAVLCGRAQAMLVTLRVQFIDEVVLGESGRAVPRAHARD